MSSWAARRCAKDATPIRDLRKELGSRGHDLNRQRSRPNAQRCAGRGQQHTTACQGGPDYRSAGILRPFGKLRAGSAQDNPCRLSRGRRPRHGGRDARPTAAGTAALQSVTESDGRARTSPSFSSTVFADGRSPGVPAVPCSSLIRHGRWTTRPGRRVSGCGNIPAANGGNDRRGSCRSAMPYPWDRPWGRRSRDRSAR